MQKLLSIPEAQRELGEIGRTTLWKLAKTGEVTEVRIGHRAFITAESIAAYVERIIAAASA
jgi:hypothetical protein